MAAALSRSWSFFSGNQKAPNKDYLHQDYQPGTPSTRVNLQERFSGGEGRPWRTGPLPPVPTPTQRSESEPQSGESQADKGHQVPSQVPHDHHNNQEKKENDQNSQASHPPLQWDHVASCGAKPTNPNNPTNPPNVRYPLRSLSRLPSGVTPLWNNLQGNVKQLKPQTSKILHEGGKKMNKALQGVRTSLSSLSQMFRSSTRRRYKLDGGTPTRTPRRTPRRTPGKLYSPFNMSTPPTPYSYKTKRLQNAPPKRNLHGNENPGLVRTPQHRSQWTPFSSPSRSLQRDTAAMNHSIRELEHITSNIILNGRGKWVQFR